MCFLLRKLLNHKEESISDYERELIEEEKVLETEHKIEQLSTEIQFLIKGVASLLMDPNPYPLSLFDSIEKMQEYHSSIQKKKRSGIYTKSLDASKEGLFFDEQSSLIDKNEMALRHSLYDALIKTGKIDLISIQNTLLDRYFSQIKNYWETVIGSLKRKNAIINRRQYLIDNMSEFKIILSSKGIHEYDSLLDDYIDFNKNELQKIT